MPHSAMTYVLALLAAIIGTVLGFVLGAAIASAVAGMLGITSFEGASGYFAVFVGGPPGALLGLALGAVLVLWRYGHRSFAAVAGRLALVFAGVVCVGGAVLAGFWFMRPIINTNGPAPQLAFEIRLPPDAPVSSGSGHSTVELQTSKNRMPGTVEGTHQDESRAVIVGRVEMYYRTWQRTLVLTLPDKTDVLFDIRLGLSPEHASAFGAWQQADYIAERGKDQARRASAADGYQIRYRTEWAGED